MLTKHCEIYVIGRGFMSLDQLSPRDKVYVLDGFDISIRDIQNVKMDFVSQRLNRIDSGPHNVLITDDSVTQYFSEAYGFKYLTFKQIPLMTRDKTYDAKKYLPVLSWVAPGERSVSNQDLEYIARCVLVDKYDFAKFDAIINACTGSDCLALIDFLEFWCSEIPGQGWFDRAQVKSRTHPISNRHIADELSKVAVLAGYTSAIENYTPYRFALKVNYEPMPIPGSRPKNEKYYYQYYTGPLYQINADNLSILGRSFKRTFFLPTRNGTI